MNLHRKSLYLGLIFGIIIGITTTLILTNRYKFINAYHLIKYDKWTGRIYKLNYHNGWQQIKQQ